MKNLREDYCLYYPEEGRYSMPMTLAEARKMVKMFVSAHIVNIRTAEVFG